MKLKLKTKRVRLGDIPVGLFVYSTNERDTLAMKTEYRNNNKPECYIVATGEAFAISTDDLLVHPVEIIE